MLGALPGMRPSSLVAQAVAPARERVHPELVDSTWGRRTHAAWEQAWGQHWGAARDAFERLRAEQPDALEPRLGLAFVARGRGQYDEARAWYARALAVDPSNADVRAQAEAARWDRAGLVDLSAGSTSANGARTSDWSAAVVLPVDPRLSLTARAGALGGGDPIRGIFLDSARGGGVLATVVSGGAVVRPLEVLTLSGRFDRWSAGGTTEQFLWLDGAVRLTDRVTAHGTLRPVSGRTGSTQVGGAVDLAVATGHVLTTEFVHGIDAAPFEARSQVREFYQYTPSVRASVRAGVVRDIDPRLSATTGALAGTWYLTPATGIRAEGTTRSGAFARSSAGVGLVLRW